LRNVFGRRFVEQLVIDLAIFVSQYIALSDEVRPRDLALYLLGCFLHAARRFTDDFNAALGCAHNDERTLELF